MILPTIFFPIYYLSFHLRAQAFRGLKRNSDFSLIQTFRSCNSDIYIYNSFLLLYNKLPQTSSFKKSIYYLTVPLVRLWPWLGWILCSGSQRAEKVLSRLYSFLELRVLFSNLHGCWQNSVPCLQDRGPYCPNAGYKPWGYSQLQLRNYHLLLCDILHNMLLCFKANRRALAAASNLSDFCV